MVGETTVQLEIQRLNIQGKSGRAQNRRHRQPTHTVACVHSNFQGADAPQVHQVA